MFPNSVTFLTLPETGSNCGDGVGGHMIMSTEDAWVGAQEKGTCKPDLGKNF